MEHGDDLDSPGGESPALSSAIERYIRTIIQLRMKAALGRGPVSLLELEPGVRVSN